MILKKTAGAIVFIATLTICAASASATKTVTSPYVHEGEASIEWKGGYDIEDDKDDSWHTEAEFAYGVTSWWGSEVELEMEHDGTKDETEFSGIAWKNKFQLAPKGEFFVDPGLRIDLSKNLQDGPDELSAKLLLAKKLGEFSNKANFIFSHEIGEDSGDDWEYGFAYAIAHPVTDNFDLGVEWYSDFGNMTEDFDDEKHQVGPVAYGAIGESVGYEVGALIGVSEAAPDALLKAVVEYEF